jgi:16S rRNA (cytosine1402-N4)-methyltransferase
MDKRNLENQNNLKNNNESNDNINKAGTDNEKTHKRRVRYKGTHPRTYAEKYKEHNPEKYKDTIEKVISKGSTPAGMHISICVNEILDFLEIKQGQKGLDATLGYGGHTLHMLKCLNGEGHIYGLDIDPIEIKKTTKRLEEQGYGQEILTTINTNFQNIDKVAKEYGPFDFILADLGVSSMQIDNPERGFTYKFEGPLDLRLNPEKGISAAERIRHISVDELEGMLIENSDEPYAREIAKAIVSKNRGGEKINTTTDLKDVIEQALNFIPNKERKEAVKKSCARVFQALRIDVNNEFEVLYDFLEKLPEALASGGRVAILTFHSGEDRLVKKSFKELKRMGVYSDVAREVIRPSAEECNINPRARSTKMRWAIKA